MNQEKRLHFNYRISNEVSKKQPYFLYDPSKDALLNYCILNRLAPQGCVRNGKEVCLDINNPKLKSICMGCNIECRCRETPFEDAVASAEGGLEKDRDGCFGRDGLQISVRDV